MFNSRAMLRTSVIIGVEMALGDAACQYIEGAARWDAARCTAMGAAGFTATAPVVHCSLAALEHCIPGRSVGAVLKKVAVDTVVMPLPIGATLFSVAFYRGAGVDASARHAQQSTWDSWRCARPPALCVSPVPKPPACPS
tara:strand:+ start:1951 stop:2370 length:420 start_codon:yes stop_codon:yes gene_type:complete